MPRFVDQSETQEIQASWWAEKETCTIRRFNYGDRQWLAGQTVALGVRPGDDENALADVQIDRMNLAILERGIVRWTDDEGRSLPTSRAMIKRLTEEDAEFILSAINELNPRRKRSEADQATFRGDSGDRTAE